MSDRYQWGGGDRFDNSPQPLDLTPYCDMPEGVRLSFTPAKAAPPASRTLRITGSTIAWTGWILFGVAFELWALLSGHVKSTFSWKWWSAFRVRQTVPLWLRVVLTVPQLLFIGWLLVHLPFGLLS